LSGWNWTTTGAGAGCGGCGAITPTAASNAAAMPLATRPRLRQNARLSHRLRTGAAAPMRSSMLRQTRAGGGTAAIAASIGARRASHSATARAAAASSRSQRRKRSRARPRSVPSAYSAARRCCSSALSRIRIAQLTPFPGTP